MSSNQDKIKNLSLSFATKDEPKKKTKIKRKDHQNWKERYNKNISQPSIPLQEEKKESSPESQAQQIDLFNNPYISEAKKHLSQEKLEEYKRLGERFYAGWDFEKGGPEKVLDVAVAEISEAIKSGLHPSDLDENEIEIMSTKIGKEWYLDFGYTANDLSTLTFPETE
jgi:hypothetical protein